MAKIKYLVTGIDNTVLGNLIGTLAQGELPGEAEVLVLTEQTPRAYMINGNGVVKGMDFEQFLTATIAVERKKISDRAAAPGEKLLKLIVEESKVR